jgi:sugar O-acyltransferase (sialic acid O-acetyltransferase NeuD family)
MEVLDSVNRINQIEKRWHEIFFIDDSIASGTRINGVPAFSFEAATDLFDSALDVGISNGNPVARKLIRERLDYFEPKLVNIIDPSSIVSEYAVLGSGVIVSEQVIISTRSIVSDNVSINRQSIIGHDVLIGQDSAISSQVNLGGNVQVGNGTFIGMGAKIRERVAIGNHCVVGMGSVVMNDVPDGVLALGNPARVIKKIDGDNLFQ